MKKHLPGLALLLLLAGSAGAEDGDRDIRPRVLEMSRATVLASPGIPAALAAFLPRGVRPQKLTWPLPTKGSLLVLALPGSDPVARRIADLFQFDVGPESLAGGYAIRAWQDGRRNLVFIFGADAAALQAARFEFDASASIEMMDPNMRSLDFKKPNQEAGLQVVAGNRIVRPQYAMRAVSSGSIVPDGLVSTAAGARANRIWLDPARAEVPRAARAIQRMRAQGIEPVFVLRPGQWPGTPQPEILAGGESAERARLWRRDKRMTHFALVFETPLEQVRRLGKVGYPAWEAHVASKVAMVLRMEGRLKELVVVPRCHSDALARHYAPPPDLRDIPEALIAWSGPLGLSTTIPRADAERRVQEAGVPVVLLDTWAAPFQEGPAGETYIPSLPAGRAPDLGDVLAGVVVVGSRGTEAMLESAWDPQAGERFGLDLLTELIPRDEKDPLEGLRVLCVRLDHEAKQNLGLVPWMAPLAADLRTITKTPALVPLVARAPANDARMSEAAWDHALKLPIRKAGVDVRILSDGAALHVGVRLDRVQIGSGPFSMELKLRAPDRSGTWVIRQTHEILSFDCVPEKGAAPVEPGHLRMSRRVGPEGYEVELSFDRFALGGEAHEMRRYEFGVSWGQENLWPAAEQGGATGTLLILK